MGLPMLAGVDAALLAVATGRVSSSTPNGAA
jgi:hypothetical protein